MALSPGSRCCRGYSYCGSTRRSRSGGGKGSSAAPTAGGTGPGRGSRGMAGRYRSHHSSAASPGETHDCGPGSTAGDNKIRKMWPPGPARCWPGAPLLVLPRLLPPSRSSSRTRSNNSHSPPIQPSEGRKVLRCLHGQSSLAPDRAPPKDRISRKTGQVPDVFAIQFTSPTSCIRLAYRWCFSRFPSRSEIAEIPSVAIPSP